MLPHGDGGPAAVTGGIAEAEAFATTRRSVARFQVTPGACPDRLDAELAARGYGRGGELSLQVAATSAVLERRPSVAPPVEVTPVPAPAWLAVWHAVHGNGDPAAGRALLDRIAGATAYAGVVLDGDVVAVGRAVVDDGWGGVFGMATVPRARGRGAARAVLTALAGWAAEHGTDRLYLQVAADNAPALGVYAAMGFAELTRYHYRHGPPSVARSRAPAAARAPRRPWAPATTG